MLPPYGRMALVLYGPGQGRIKNKYLSELNQAVNGGI